MFDCPDPLPPPALVAADPLPPAAGPRRVELNGLWYDRHPDGALSFCKTCNVNRDGTYRVPPPGAAVTAEEHRALIAAGAVYVPPAAAPGVAAPRPFRGGTGYHESHSCPSCGRLQFVVAGFNGDGSHRHQCAACGQVWSHR